MLCCVVLCIRFLHMAIGSQAGCSSGPSALTKAIERPTSDNESISTCCPCRGLDACFCILKNELYGYPARTPSPVPLFHLLFFYIAKVFRLCSTEKKELSCKRLWATLAQPTTLYTCNFHPTWLLESTPLLCLRTTTCHLRRDLYS